MIDVKIVYLYLVYFTLLNKQTKKLNIISKKILDDKSINSQFITTFLQQFKAIHFLFIILQQMLIWLTQIKI